MPILITSHCPKIEYQYFFLAGLWFAYAMQNLWSQIVFVVRLIFSCSYLCTNLEKLYSIEFMKMFTFEQKKKIFEFTSKLLSFPKLYLTGSTITLTHCLMNLMQFVTKRFVQNLWTTVEFYSDSVLILILHLHQYSPSRIFCLHFRLHHPYSSLYVARGKNKLNFVLLRRDSTMISLNISKGINLFQCKQTLSWKGEICRRNQCCQMADFSDKKLKCGRRKD